MIDFALTDEQKMLIQTCRNFVENELYPLESEVERTDSVSPDVRQFVHNRAIELGLHAANIPAEFGGGGLGGVDYALMEKEMGRASLALNDMVHRPHNILCASVGQQKVEYLDEAVAGRKRDCIAMTEPDACSDVRAMKTSARRDGDDWIVSGTKHFISWAGISDFILLFVATGEETIGKQKKKKITCFLCDTDAPGVTVSKGYDCVSHRGHMNNIISLDDVRIPNWKILGEEGRGFELLNEWVGVARLSSAAQSVGRAERAFDVALKWAATRRQFGQQIGKFQGVSFKLADMAMEIKLANLLLLECGWKIDQGAFTVEDGAHAKIFCTEMLGRVSDQAIQIAGGMGLMTELPLERIWRDHRIERIWDGTNEIQRHIVSRGLLRPLGA